LYFDEKKSNLEVNNKYRTIVTKHERVKDMRVTANTFY